MDAGYLMGQMTVPQKRKLSRLVERKMQRVDVILVLLPLLNPYDYG